ncbi:SEL1-like repeat protein [Chitinophaga flava]|uniref:Uncharacterized protein n=1 Tax=Chitinophaga flava TaxID=2259036 RepID=A0A365XT17_9BACT|nr:SEL1-like repeat protein [Chitinophaga flava]RBL89516.1 hypothetical protein DF182_23685 [Chitinophaga flava]
MSYRIYLYNFNNTENHVIPEARENGTLYQLLPVIGGNGNDNLMMMEWKYEFPFFLHPLFAGAPYLGTPLYNGDSGGIYADGPDGIRTLSGFYDFIEQHADILTDDPVNFREQKEKIFSFLDTKARYNSFHLDAWDVFNMDNEPHAEQAAELLSLIQETNACIQAAINANDPTLLNECPDLRKNPYGFKSFREFFSNNVYGYGWEVIQSGYYADDEEEKEDEQQTFTENGMMGLKDTAGNIIIPAGYDEVFVFPGNEALAVVKRDGKYGYVNRQGQPVTDIIFDDAFDAANGVAVVQVNGKEYLIQPGITTPVTGYDEILIIAENPQLYAAGRDGKYAVMDAAGQLKLPFDFHSDMEITYVDGMPLLKAPHLSGVLHFYTPPSFARIGDDNTVRVEWTGTFNHSPLLRTIQEQQQGKKKQQLHGLATTEGQQLLPTVYQEIAPGLEDGVIVRQQGKYGVYSASKGWILEMGFDRINHVYPNAYIIAKDKKEGLYFMGQPLVPPAYQVVISDVIWLGEDKWETLAINTDAAFRIGSDGHITPLTPTDIAAKIGPDERYRYGEKELAMLTALAGDAVPADLLYQKGFEAFEKQQYEEAIRYYKMAAGKGSGEAMNDLGYLYETAEGYIDKTIAFDWYSRGVQAGSPHAANGLANCYQHGNGTAPDIRKALDLYETAAAHHVPHAYYNLAMLYYNGEKVPQDYEKALRHFVYASRFGYDCHSYVGYLFEEKEDYNNAFDAYKSGVKNNDGYCAINLARLYELGLGCKADPRKAISYYIKAAELGEDNAHLELRRLYLYNDVVKDEAKAREHEQLALDAGLDIS